MICKPINAARKLPKPFRTGWIAGVCLGCLLSTCAIVGDTQGQEPIKDRIFLPDELESAPNEEPDDEKDSENENDSLVLPVESYIEPLMEPEQAWTTLQEFEQAAIFNNPTLQSAQARVLVARGKAEQAGYQLNPNAGVFADEVGNNDSALLGVFVGRTFQRGNKVCLRQEAASQQGVALERQFEVQRQRVITDVRLAFFKVLITQKQVELAEQLNAAQQKATGLIRELVDAKESPRTDLYQAEIKAQQSLIRLNQTRIALEGSWRQLVSVTGQPELQQRHLNGQVDVLPDELDWNSVVSHLMENSPEIAAAYSQIQQAQAARSAAVANSIPDVNAQLTLGVDTGSDDAFTGLQVSMPMQVYNRNEGNIRAAEANITVAEQELLKVQASIKSRLATVFQNYHASLMQTRSYSEQLLPKASQTLKLVTEGYREGEVSFLQLLAAQQTTIDLTTQYLQSLSLLWSSHHRIKGMLLGNSLSQ